MQRLTIVKSDSVVGIDGVFRSVDCSSLPEEFHALEFDFVKSKGEIEWRGDPKPHNTKITDVLDYNSFIDAWKRADPIPTMQPAISKDTQTCEETDPVKIDGEWYQAWAVRDLTPEEIIIRDEERRAHLVQDINAYRDKKIASGFVFNGVAFDSRPEDQKRISGAGTLAFIAITQGAQPGDYYWHGEQTPFSWITQSNDLMEMDAFTMVEFGRAAAKHESAHVFAARMLKDMNPIPDEYTDPIYWP